VWQRDVDHVNPVIGEQRLERVMNRGGTRRGELYRALAARVERGDYPGISQGIECRDDVERRATAANDPEAE
jgi:hypothetical protein